jgi:hypothetical protein
MGGVSEHNPDSKREVGIGGTEECFFRGHGDGTWKLQPTLLREAERRGREYVELDGDLFGEFQGRAFIIVRFARGFKD